MFRIALAVMLLLATAPPSPHFVGILPNPVVADDVGEYVVLEFPHETNVSGWSLRDGETIARFPEQTVRGRVVATTDPAAVRTLTDHPVVALRGHLALANGGETVRLVSRDETVDAVTYPRAPEGERYVRTNDGWMWRSAGATDLPIVGDQDVRASLFVLPDAPEPSIASLDGARDRILLAGYTFASARVAEALCDARGRGVTVRVLLEREPVGGLTGRSAERLDELVACGVDVLVIGGPRARYAFHHAKYAVVDDRALVLTENWKPAGTGGRSSRGWGVLLESHTLAATLAETFRADASWRDAVPWESVRRDMRSVAGEQPPTERYPERFTPHPTRLDRVDVVVAPDNAEGAIVDVLDAAESSILVEQLSIGSRGQPFVRALFRAAERGVRVRILLSGAWYVGEENAAVAGSINERGDREGLPIEARLAEPRSRFGKIHAKGAVVDGEVVILGSINWNNASVRENREVDVILRDDDAGRYYARVFRADWRGGRWRLPVGFAAVAVVGALGAGTLGRRLRFEE